MTLWAVWLQVVVATVGVGESCAQPRSTDEFERVSAA